VKQAKIPMIPDDSDEVCTANSIEQANYALGLDSKRRAAVEWDVFVEELRDDLAEARDLLATGSTSSARSSGRESRNSRPHSGARGS
jgi:hypothetical protein